MDPNNVIHLITRTNDPFNKNDWKLIRKDTLSALELILSGVVALKKANCINGEGHYPTAFHNLSIGIEKLAKLILTAEHVIQNSGKPPNKNVTKKYGHELIMLLDTVGNIAEKHHLELKHPRPHDDISIAIIDNLHSFAIGGRYDYSDNLGNPNSSDETDYIKQWWNKVAELILTKHPFDKNIEKKMSIDTETLLERIKKDNTVQCINELGKAMKDDAEILEWDGKTQIVQDFGLFYTLRIVQWIAEVFVVLSKDSGHDILFEHYKIFEVFIMLDDELKAKIKCP